MIFNSIEYLIFFPIVFILYWALSKKIAYQNILLLISSYIFYGWWDWRFLLLLIFSTALDYFSGLRIYESKTQKGKQFWMWLSVIINLGVLGYFKYANFFITSWIDSWALLGIKMHVTTLQILLPIGISFYTFHGLSYVIDIYNGRIVPTKNWNNYSLFVNFFPLLVAGPIERATHLLPQIENPRKFDYQTALSGLRQILWGLFKKVVIADQCAGIVDSTFGNPEIYSGSTLFIGALIFTFQIYADFSGYSDIALGSAKLIGFDLLKNFNFPYFSKSIPEFWHKWHMSLSSWLNDYVFTPTALELRNYGKRGVFMAIMITFIISGFWHGAGWTFIVWGTLHGLYYIPSIFFSNKKITSINGGKSKNKKLENEPLELHKIIGTFLLVCFTLIFFRSSAMADALTVIKGILNTSIISKPDIIPFIPLIGITFMLCLEWIARNKTNGVEFVFLSIPQPIRWALYYVLIFAIITFSDKSVGFIYFQF